MDEGPTAPELTHDAFLGGRLHLWQPRRGYRAGIDPVLLAASVPAQAGQSVLDLGCGAGAAMLCLATRVPGLELTGLEVQSAYADLARRNASENRLPAQVIAGDVADMPDVLKQRRFEHVITNPPYFDRARSTAAPEAGREGAMGEGVPLPDWIGAAARRVAPGGYLSVIHRAERLPDLLTATTAHLGSLEVLPLIPRRGRPARLVIVRARRDGRAAPRLHDGWLLHAGAAHDADRESYTVATASVLRDAAPLSMDI